MNIAVATDGDNLQSEVSEKFNLCKFLLIINMPDLNFKIIKNEGAYSGEKLAEKVKNHRCEALITAKLTPKEFDILADACITRYFALGHAAEKATAYGMEGFNEYT